MKRGAKKPVPGSVAGGGGGGTPPQREELFAQRRARGREMMERRWATVRSGRPYIYGFVVLALVLLVVVLTASSLTLQKSIFVQSGVRAGTGFGAAVGFAMLDTAALELLRDTLTTLTEGCTPATGNPALDAVGAGTRAQTYASWQGVKAAVDPNCQFYGLDAAEFASASQIGPLEMCWGYSHVGLQIFQVFYQGAIPADITSRLNDAYDIAYPLTMYWNRIPGGKGVVVGRVLEILNEATLNPSNVSLVADRVAREFCNEFFATDDLARYQSRAQPWLAFPFPGTMQHVGNNSITGAAATALGDIVVDPSTPFRRLFAVGDVLAEAPAMRLLAEAVFGQLTLEEFSASSVAEALNLIYEEIYDDFNNIISSDVPVMVFGRYAEDIGVFNNARESDASILYMMTDSDPDGDLLGTTMADTILNRAETRNVLSQADMTSTLFYEDVFGDVYKRELDVAEVIVQIVRPVTNIEFNETGALFETFALKNTIVNGTDLGGRIDVMDARDDLSVDGERVSLGFALTPNSLQLLSTVVEDDPVTFGASIPQDVNWLEDRPECMPPVVNQGPCNNCWAISAASSVGARFCTQGITQKWADLSRQHVTSCSGASSLQGCNPNFPETGFSFLQSTGAVDEACFPFMQGTSRYEAPCIDECTKLGNPFTTFRTSRSSYRWLRNTNAIKLELAQNGPLAIGFDIPSNFIQFFRNNPTGIYDDEKSPGIGGHLVVLVGYCGSCATPHWILQNSWGKSFGDNGYFRVKIDMRRGVNGQVWFERYAYLAAPFGRTTSDSTVVKVPAQDVRAQDEKTFVVNAGDDAKIVEVQPDPPPGSAAAAPAPAAFVHILLVAAVLLVFLWSL